MKYIFTIIMLITFNLCGSTNEELTQQTAECVRRICKTAATFSDTDMNHFVKEIKTLKTFLKANEDLDDEAELPLDLNEVQMNFCEDIILITNNIDTLGGAEEFFAHFKSKISETEAEQRVTVKGFNIFIKIMEDIMVPDEGQREKIRTDMAISIQEGIRMRDKNNLYQ